MNLPEITPENLPDYEDTKNASDALVEMTNASFRYSSFSPPVVVNKDTEDFPLIKSEADNLVGNLTDISFSVKPGECIAIIGKVGSGKSSLLFSLFGGLIKTGGSVVVRSKKMCLVEVRLCVDIINTRKYLYIYNI